MGKQTFNRITKTLGIILLVFAMMFMTAASASAKNVYNPANIQDGHKAGYGSRDYKMGSLGGAQDGYQVGYNAGTEDCLNYDQIGVLTKIPAPDIKNKWTNNYKRGYKESFKKGYIAGYHNGRLKCLKK
jgi:hypothetical protein